MTIFKKNDVIEYNHDTVKGIIIKIPKNINDTYLVEILDELQLSHDPKYAAGNQIEFNRGFIERQWKLVEGYGADATRILFGQRRNVEN